MIKSEYVRILGMLGSLKNTHADGKLLDESAATYFKLLILPVFEENGIKINKGLRKFKTIYNAIDKLHNAEHPHKPFVLPFSKTIEDEWGVEGVDWNWEWEYE